MEISSDQDYIYTSSEIDAEEGKLIEEVKAVRDVVAD